MTRTDRYIFANSFRQQPRFTILNLAVLAAGQPIYLLWRSRAKRDAIDRLAAPTGPDDDLHLA